jgi:CHASE3 domain sensor protein
MMTKANDLLQKRAVSSDECGPLCRMNIGVKINLGFGALVLTTLMVIALSILAGHRVANNMAVTADLRAPSTLASSRAQTELLRMLADVRGYLALSEEGYREGYLEARGRFEENLMELENMAEAYESLSENYHSKLEALRSSFEEWSKLPSQLFVLHGDQLEREPGLKMLIKEGSRPIALIVVTTKKMIETQQGRKPTVENLQMFGHMASFQASFYAMVAGLRGYATTGRDNFKFEYTTNLSINSTGI